MKVNTIQTKGKIHKLNEKVEKVSWNPLGFKENEEYKLVGVKTQDDPVLLDILSDLINKT